MDVLNGKPVKAFLLQDHEAHIQVHMAAIQDPKIQQLVSQSPMATTIAASMASHIQEHLGFQYRKEIEKELGVALPAVNEELPPEVENKLSRLIAEAAQRLYDKNVAEAGQKEIQEQQQDPVIQMQQAKLQLQAQELERKTQSDKARVASDMAKAEMRQETETKRIDAQTDIDGARLGVEIAKTKEQSALKEAEISEKAVLERAKLAAEVARLLVEDERSMSKER
jgi:hypothetical protein